MATYTPHTGTEVKTMLKKIGLGSLKALFRDIPADLKLKTLSLPKGKTQADTERYIKEIAAKNRIFKTVLRGAGAYSHYIPQVVKYLSARSEFLTAYTPYQAELSQGILQSIFEYQTMIAELTGLDAANASHYDGATAAAEALMMCVEKNRKKVLVSPNIRPDTLQVIRTYLKNSGFEIVIAPAKRNALDLEKTAEILDNGFAAVYLEQPGYNGAIEDAERLGALAHSFGAKFVMGVYPIALGLIKKPSECSADIAVGDGQPLGLGLSFGGPYLGFMAASKAMQRKLPGRIVGETVDARGNRAYVLTLQAREQHIRREKAASNICSNQAHCALVAAMYLSVMGAEGLKCAAKASFDNAHYLKDCLLDSGLSLENEGEFFNEFVTVSSVPAAKILDALSRKNILGGLALDEYRILWCATETITAKEIKTAARLVKEACL